MKGKSISYYELLGMIKEGNIPKRIYVKIANYGMYYIANYDGEEFSYYELQDNMADENYHFYLSECFLESNMFEKCIQLLDGEEFEDIEPLEQIVMKKVFYKDVNDLAEEVSIAFEKIDEIVISINQLIKNQKILIEKINKLEK